MPLSSMLTRRVNLAGLHLDPTALIERGILTQMDCYVRSRSFWGIFSLDKVGRCVTATPQPSYLSLRQEFNALLGRPGTLVDISITCPRPPRWHEDDHVSRIPQARISS